MEDRQGKLTDLFGYTVRNAGTLHRLDPNPTTMLSRVQRWKVQTLQYTPEPDVECRSETPRLKPKGCLPEHGCRL